MKILWMARIVNREKVGSRAYYSVTDPTVVTTMQFMASVAGTITLPPGWGA